MATVTLDGLEFSGGGGDGSGFYFTSLVDWFKRAESKSVVRERPQAVGAFGIGTDWSSSLALTLTGSYQGDSAEDVERAFTRLNSIGSGGRKVSMSFAGALPATSRLVSVRSITPEDYHGRTEVQFVIDLIAADPLRYGPSVSVVTGPPVSGGGLLFPLGSNPLAFWDFGADGSSGRVSVSNVGSAAVWPTISATGGMSEGFVATNVSTGESVRFERPIPVGSTVSVNQRTGRASIDGQSDVSGFITQRGFFSVPAGVTQQIQFSVLGVSSGSPQFSVSWAPAYL